ncbi:MAG: tryptophan--tRNA ligase [Bdellovibrionales bacterium]|nr:tryptophan--tRNA ligase [Bdellovibrionales bacterium]
MKKILTGIKATGQVHLGNYLGAIKPSVELSKSDKISSYLFIADSHALTSHVSFSQLNQSVYEIGATWLACGLNTEKVFFYRQSDIPELFELYWILSCITPKGLMNRAHSYKDRKEKNIKLGKKDLDDKIYMGLYNYPILMSADILLFSPDEVPVGQDQIQHLEMARDIAGKFNHRYKTDLFVLPKAFLRDKSVVLGLDGQKMSKSYNNTIPLFLDSNKLYKLIRKIKTDSSSLQKKKDTNSCLIFQIYKGFASLEEIDTMKKLYAEGIGWGEAKEILFHKLESYFKEKKEIYNFYVSQPKQLDKLLKQGAEKVRVEASSFLKEIKKVLGF